MRFMARAAESGLLVNKPFGESQNYDFVVGRQGRFVSVQVKSTTNEFEGGYLCNVGMGDHSYAAGAFDFLAAYVVPEDVWSIIPQKRIRGMRCISLYTHSGESKYERYREAWHLLQEAAGTGQDEGSQDAAERAEVCAAGGGDADAPAEDNPMSRKGGETLRPGPGQAWGTQTRFPTSGLGRMEVAFGFVRRQVEGNYPRRQKREEEG